MKILRILAFILLLNVPCSHAMEQASIVNLAKAALCSVGIIMIADGVVRASEGDSPIAPTPKINACSFGNDVFSRVTGVVETGVGVFLMGYSGQ